MSVVSSLILCHSIIYYGLYVFTPTGLALVRGDCEGQQSCAFTAGITYFNNDPCYGTYKYTTVNYICVYG